jgi:large subunit ribosomal protein L18
VIKIKYGRNTAKKVIGRLKSKARIRKKVEGSAERPRLALFRSGKHIYAQLIDDTTGRTLAAVSTLKLKPSGGSKNVDAAKLVGTAIAEAAKKNKIENVVFDRSGYLYHGRVKALAEAAREGGLKF